MFYLLKGIIIGLAIAAPVGPIGLLCIRRTVVHGRLSGLLTGLGAATADGFYGIIAAFGLTAVTSIILQQKMVLSFIGGIVLCYLGIKTFMSKPAEHSSNVSHKGLLRDYTSTVVLTITNPATILSFLAIFAGVGIETGNYKSAAVLVTGVFSGSALWWLTLSGVVGFIHKKVNIKHLGWINKASGVIIAVFGIAALGTIILQFR